MKGSKFGAYAGIGISIAGAVILVLQENATTLHVSLGVLGVAAAVVASFAKALGEPAS